MKSYYTQPIEKSPRIDALIDALYKNMPEIEADRAVLLTESYQMCIRDRGEGGRAGSPGKHKPTTFGVDELRGERAHVYRV